jgi:hypothetical protein
MSGKLIAGAAVAGVAGMLPSVTQAAIATIDLRINPASQVGGDAKSLGVSNNQVVTLDLYAVITNGDANKANDGAQSFQGSFTSSGTGTILGNYRGDTGTTASQQNNVTGFQHVTSQSGFVSDLDGDGDLDVGSTTTANATVEPFFLGTSNSGTAPVLGSGTTGNAEFLIGQITFTVTNASLATTSLNFTPRLVSGGLITGQRNEKFRVDGFDYNVNGNGTGTKIAAGGGTSTGVTGTLAQGTSVLLTPVPEPVSLGVLGLGAAALLRRRKA